MDVCHVADQSAVARLLLLGQVFRHRLGLAEAVGEVAIGQRDQQPCAGEAALHRVPLLLCEVRFGRHTRTLSESEPALQSRPLVLGHPSDAWGLSERGQLTYEAS